MTPDPISEIDLTTLLPGQIVQLFNTYRGIPITTDARLLAKQDSCLVLQVDPRQAVCLFLDSKTCLFDPATAKALDCAVLGLDITSLEATIADFHIDPCPEKRTTVRVQPEEIIEVTLTLEGCTLTAKLADVSQVGLGLFSFDTYIYCEGGFNEGAPVSASLRLPGVNDVIQCEGRIVHAFRRIDPRLHRLGIQISPDSTSLALLQQYIDQRVWELNHELQFIYESMLAARTQEAMNGDKKTSHQLRTIQ